MKVMTPIEKDPKILSKGHILKYNISTVKMPFYFLSVDLPSIPLFKESTEREETA